MIRSESGCIVEPDFERPKAPSVERYTPEELPLRTASAAVTGGAAHRFQAFGTFPANDGGCSIRPRSMR